MSHDLRTGEPSERPEPPSLAFPPVVPARFVRRLNRFVAEVELVGHAPASPRTLVHVPTTGRMAELLVEGARVHVAPAANRGRLTRFDLMLVEGPEGLVCIDARLPNRLLARHWLGGSPGPAGLPLHGLTTEPRHHRGRFDFRLLDEDGPMLVEVKSVTLVRHGVALFPDAPTARGARHLDDLRGWVEAGGRAAAVFVVQRIDADRVAPNRETDPVFSHALRKAAAAGVIVVGYRAAVTLEGAWIVRGLPVDVGD